jgi:hypothetical protein
MVMCESCMVLFEAPSALGAYDKALLWAEDYATGTNFALLGIQHITDIIDEQIGDGTEIGGRFFSKKNPWERKDMIIPDVNEIPIVVLEKNDDKPISDFIPEDALRQIKRKYKQITGEQ